jgi:hypothetical protein
MCDREILGQWLASSWQDMPNTTKQIDALYLNIYVTNDYNFILNTLMLTFSPKTTATTDYAASLRIALALQLLPDKEIKVVGL